jgi:kynurenine formamidase
MKGTLQYKGSTWEVDYLQPLDISLPLQPETVRAFDAPPLQIEPVIKGDFTGAVSAGAPVNFNNIFLNPHGHGTHTECVGHITEKKYTINQCLQQFYWIGELITIEPQKLNNGDQVIEQQQVKDQLQYKDNQAVLIRTLPNTHQKQEKNYTGTNPPYLTPSATQYLREEGVQHLLVDLPSVDREDDGRQLKAHKAFWNYPEDVRASATITEMIYVPDSIKNGRYLLNLQIISLANDASPSKPILYKLK